MFRYLYSLSAKRMRERFVVTLFFLVTSLSLLVTLSLIGLLLKESLLFFRTVSWRAFLSDVRWSPLFVHGHYGILPLVTATLVSSVVALLVAIILGTLIAVYLSEFSPQWFREMIKPFLELLAGVPTIVYGYFALTFVTPLLQKVWPALPGFNLLSAGLVMGLMVLPYVTSLSEDAMRMVPLEWREASYALGATRLQTVHRVVYPAAFSGIFSSYVLAASRVLGETMIVSIAGGGQSRMVFTPLQSGQTMTAYIVQVVGGDVPYNSLAFHSVFAVALFLFVLTLLFNLFGQWMRKRFYYGYQ